MDTYIRFQTQLRCRDTGRPAGIFYAAGQVRDSGQLSASAQESLQRILKWFNHNLRAPALNNRNWRCLFWFRGESQEGISRLWELVYLLEDEGVNVKKVRTTQPGMIVYRDEHQVAAIPEIKSIALRV